MDKPIVKIALAGALIVIAAVILLTQLSRGDGTRPTAKVEPGQYATSRASDESEDGTPLLPGGMNP